MIVDDDTDFAEALCAALERFGAECRFVACGEAALELYGEWLPTRSVIDLNMPGMGGLELVKRLHLLSPELSMVVLTGYAAVQTAVEAIKLGARHYLPKPAKAAQIWEAFERVGGDSSVNVSQAEPLLQTEHKLIMQALARNQFNLSAAARELKMHRRTLQRKLYKMPEWRGTEYARENLSA